MPLAASFSPMARLALGEMVLASAATVPGFAPSMTPFGSGEHLLRHARVAHAGEDKVGLFGHLFRGCAGDRFFLRGELLRFARGVRPHRHLVAGARQVPRHRITHETQSKKSKLCHTQHGTNEAMNSVQREADPTNGNDNIPAGDEAALELEARSPIRSRRRLCVRRSQKGMGWSLHSRGDLYWVGVYLYLVGIARSSQSFRPTCGIGLGDNRLPG